MKAFAFLYFRRGARYRAVGIFYVTICVWFPTYVMVKDGLQPQTKGGGYIVSSMNVQDGPCNEAQSRRLRTDAYRINCGDRLCSAGPTRRAPRQYVVLVIVHSKVDHFTHRAVIRKTWGSVAKIDDGSDVSVRKRHTRYQITRRPTRVVFMLARSRDAQVEARVANESSAYGDIVQGDYVDHYKNMTRKHIMALQWARTYCTNARHIVKVDDDVFVNVFKLSQLLDAREAAEERTETSGYPAGDVACYTNLNAPVMRSHNCGVPTRDKNCKWTLTEDEFQSAHFPTYCSGAIIVYSPAVAGRLVRRSRLTECTLWIDDVYMTGVLVSEDAGAKHSHEPALLPVLIETEHVRWQTIRWWVCVQHINLILEDKTHMAHYMGVLWHLLKRYYLDKQQRQQLRDELECDGPRGFLKRLFRGEGISSHSEHTFGRK